MTILMRKRSIPVDACSKPCFSDFFPTVDWAPGYSVSFAVYPNVNTSQIMSIQEDQAWMSWIEERMGSISREAQLDLPLFKKILGIERAYYADRLFALFDVNHRECIIVADLLRLLSAMTKATAGKKLRLIFDICCMLWMIYVDGPYGTPSGRIFNAELAVLICAGIGVTPLIASILQSIMYRHHASKLQSPE